MFVGAFLVLRPGPSESWVLVRGTGTASDGRIAITVGESRLSLLSAVENGTPDVFLLVNLTFVNVGNGNTTVGAGWFVNATWNDAAVANTWSMIPGRDGEGELPLSSALAPCHRATGWLAFYLQPIGDTSGMAAAVHLEKVTYLEESYGGQAVGHDVWVGISTLHVRFEILPT